ncbi:polysaccharide deacetylase family protein [Candidatus Woesebacteria bacterium]|nr:polysaccharide deacetylase family protein [Candidatus Woesebacteria bacterium]
MKLTIVMYHYVRDVLQSSYPNIKALALDEFYQQLDYIGKHYTVVRMEDVLLATEKKFVLPKNALLLTFDDGYRDHYQTVFPELKKRGWQGSFFPTALTLFERRVLNVNKIQFVVSVCNSAKELVRLLLEKMDKARQEYQLLSDEEYFAQHAQSGRYDEAEIMFFKRMLQHVLPSKLRSKITDELFREFVSDDETNFSEQLYLSISELIEMRKAGMFVGGHGYNHIFLSALSPKQQEQEISASLKVLSRVGSPTDNWVLCYPYGMYDQAFVSVLKKRGCRLGLTLKVGVADLDADSLLELPRLDTNDLPKDRTAPPSVWTTQIA